MMLQVWGCSQDNGGTRGLIPVLAQLEKIGGFSLRILANGVAPRFFQAAGVENVEVCDDPTSILAEGSRPDILVTSLDSKGSIGEKMVRALRAENYKGAIVALSDYPVSSAPTGGWEDIRPDWVTSGSPANSAVIRKSWPDFPTDHIFETGFPAFDRFVGVDIGPIRAEVRQSLRLRDNQYLVAFLANVYGATAALEVFARVFLALESETRVAIRAHPSMESLAPEEYRSFRTVAETLHGRIVETMGVFQTDQVVSASDLVVASYSTALGESAAQGVAGVNLAVPVMEKEYLEATQGVAPIFPWVAEGVCAEARNEEDLYKLLLEGQTGELKKRYAAAQTAGLRLDGHSARRVAEFILGISAGC